jgi:hypothetical protein
MSLILKPPVELPPDLEELYLRVVFRYDDAEPEIVHVDVLDPSAARIMAAAAVNPDDEAFYGAIETQIGMTRKN